MARIVLAVGVVVLLSFVGWLAFAEAPIAPMPPEPAPSAQAVEPASPAAAPADAAVAMAEGSVERTSAPALASDSLPPIPADAKWVDVFVLDKQTKQPIEGAEAMWSDETAYEQIQKLPEAERMPLYRDQDRIAQRWGWRGRSDRDGKLRVHLGKQWTIVQAWHQDRFGTTSLQARGEPPKEGHRVLLEVDCTVRVHVVDATGQPAAGVALSLETYDPARSRAMVVGGELETDANGMATFAHVQHRRTAHSGAQAGKTVTQWRLFVVIPGLELPPILVDAVQVPSEPIEVQLPPTGRLRAKVTFSGKPMPGLQVGFHVGPKDDSAAINGAANATVDPDGWTRFGHVPLGKTLFVVARQRSASTTRELAGPTLPGQEVELVLELADESFVLTGRLLGDDGQPLADQEVGGSFDATRSMGGVSVRTDAAGRFVWWIASRWKDGEEAIRLKKLLFERRSSAGPAMHVDVPPRDLVVGTNDLGDLRFAVAQLVVSGRFAFDTPGSGRTWASVARLGEARASSSGEERWERIGDLRVDVDEDGRFEVRGTLPPGRQRIEAQGLHLPVKPVEFAVGTRDLVIPVQRGSTLEASCRLPDGLPPESIQLRLQPRTPATNDTQARGPGPFRMRGDPLLAQARAPVDGVVPYTWSALPAGTYDLRVEAIGSAAPFVVVQDVVVPEPAGGDPRLLAIDLRELVTTLRVRVELTGQDANSRETPMVFQLPQANEQEWQGVPANTELVLPMPKHPVDLLVACDGYHAETLRGAVGSATVTLRPWPTVQVTFTGREALPAGAHLRASAHATNAGKRDERRYSTPGRGGMLGDLLAPPMSLAEVKDGVIDLPIGDGVHGLSVYLSLAPGKRGKFLKQMQPNELVAGAPVSVHLSADEIRSVVAELQQQEAKAKEGK